jgi:hypothetical protein
VWAYGTSMSAGMMEYQQRVTGGWGRPYGHARDVAHALLGETPSAACCTRNIQCSILLLCNVVCSTVAGGSGAQDGTGPCPQQFCASTTEFLWGITYVLESSIRGNWVAFLGSRGSCNLNRSGLKAPPPTVPKIPLRHRLTENHGDCSRLSLHY